MKAMNSVNLTGTPEKMQKDQHRKQLRRLIAIILVTAAVAIAAALGWLAAVGTPLSLHMIIATSLGVGLSVFLGGGLMALVFFSARTGMDSGGSHHRKEDE